jgi:hypothetical protein
LESAAFGFSSMVSSLTTRRDFRSLLAQPARASLLVKPNSAYSDDGGKTWKQSSHRPAGYRCGAAVVPDTPGPTVFAVGPTGMDYSTDRGKNWERMNEEHVNTIGFADAHRGWAVGQKGLILKFEGTVPGAVAPSLKK